MNFSTEPFEPLKVSVPAEYYENVLRNYSYNPDSTWPDLNGEIEIDGEFRYVKFSLKEGVVRDVEITLIEKQDLFCGVSMSSRVKKFQKELQRAGFESRIEDCGLELLDHPVSFFIEGGKVASICWGVR